MSCLAQHMRRQYVTDSRSEVDYQVDVFNPFLQSLMASMPPDVVKTLRLHYTHDVVGALAGKRPDICITPADSHPSEHTIASVVELLRSDMDGHRYRLAMDYARPCLTAQADMVSFLAAVVSVVNGTVEFHRLRVGRHAGQTADAIPLDWTCNPEIPLATSYSAFRMYFQELRARSVAVPHSMSVGSTALVKQQFLGSGSTGCVWRMAHTGGDVAVKVFGAGSPRLHEDEAAMLKRLEGVEHVPKVVAIGVVTWSVEHTGASADASADASTVASADASTVARANANVGAGAGAGAGAGGEDTARPSPRKRRRVQLEQARFTWERDLTAIVMTPVGSRFHHITALLNRAHLRCLVAALKGIHARNIKHGDIRPPNLLRVDDTRAVVIDFSHATSCESASDRFNTDMEGLAASVQALSGAPSLGLWQQNAAALAAAFASEDPYATFEGWLAHGVAVADQV